MPSQMDNIFTFNPLYLHKTLKLNAYEYETEKNEMHNKAKTQPDIIYKKYSNKINIKYFRSRNTKNDESYFNRLKNNILKPETKIISKRKRKSKLINRHINQALKNLKFINQSSKTAQTEPSIRIRKLHNYHLTSSKNIELPTSRNTL